MKTSALRSLAPEWADVARMIGRGGSLIMISMVASFVAGQGLGHAALHAPEIALFVALGTMCVGLLVGFRHEMAGGLIAIVGLAAMFAIEMMASGRWLRGWVWWFFAVPALAYLISARLRHGEGVAHGDV